MSETRGIFGGWVSETGYIMIECNSEWIEWYNISEWDWGYISSEIDILWKEERKKWRKKETKKRRKKVRKKESKEERK